MITWPCREVSKTLLTIATCCVIAGCASVPTVPDDAEAVPFEVIDEATTVYSGFHDRARLVIKDDNSLAAFWAILERFKEPKTDPPYRHFDRQMVVAAAMGARGSGGYTIQIDGVYTKDGRLHVVVHETSPGSGCVVSQAFTQPVTAAWVMVYVEDVVFVEQETTTPCGS